ncbi:transcription-repair coupling factor [candidate division WOR-3 bacterium]|nr:transcription-repair coupling factor [candidate division WOR-3 bacterium]
MNQDPPATGLEPLLDRCAVLLGLDRLVARLRSAPLTRLGGAPPGLRPLLAVAVAERLQQPVVLALDDDDAAAEAGIEVAQLRPGLPRAIVTADSLALDDLIAGLPAAGPAVMVTAASTLLEPVPVPLPPAQRSLTLAVGTPADSERVTGWLEDADYERTDLVTETGEYAVRGGIIDAWPDGAGEPLRCELLDDAVLSLRRFDPLTQRSTGTLSGVTVRTRRRPPPGDRRLHELLADGAVVLSVAPLEVARPLAVFDDGPGPDANLDCRPVESYLGNLELLGRDLAASGHDCIVVSSDAGGRDRLRVALGEKPAYLVGRYGAGFACPAARLTVLTEREVYGRPLRRTVRHRFRGLPVDNLVTLRPGDLIVHVDYGIGRFDGTERVTRNGVEKDYLVLSYAGRDRVLVPVENLGLLDRYVGAGDASPRLDRIGGRSWLLARAKAARASAEYAAELLDIQARRAVASGFRFTTDGEWQEAVAGSFPYDETPDQARAIAAVREDMAGAKPMDRLVCGDVGYGKTEIALRAAVKAVENTKQVAVLVPTTILCYQHYDSFRRRLAGFPVRVEMLSRMVSAARRREVLAGLADGRVDIVVGTHGLLAPSVRYRDLGLLIVDEEQKFGVKQKERIKQVKAAVDILTLTATPVPRTLYLALSGLRDISTVHTPPPGRREVLSEVSSWHDGLVVEYIERELRRGGQVFFVHNRIRTIEAFAARLRRLLPGLDFTVAHGRMPARELERLYLEFATGEHRLLLSTAIIESGLDLPNVNTIIIDRADTFGLADLHQLRGRVGRSGRQAHALFLVPREREITADARKRLSALLAYSQLGAGFKLALRDLEIRGAGDLLGLRQHGQVARVGLNLYARMLGEAAARLKGEQVTTEPELALALTAFLPADYVQDSFERVALYRRLLGLDSLAELAEFRLELADRFGRYPPVVENLFRIARVRILARRLGLLKVELKPGGATVVGPDSTTRLAGGIEELLGWLSERAGEPADLDAPAAGN